MRQQRGFGSGGHELCAVEEDGAAEEDAVDGEGDEAVFANPVEEPLDYAEGHDEGHCEADEEDGPALGIHNDVRGCGAGDSGG